MSNTTSSLHKKIDRANELQSVVRTMKALAASSIGQYEQSVRALTDYYRTIELGLGASLRESEPVTLTGDRIDRAGTNEVAVVVFGSDQGLVGQFNEVVANCVLESLADLRGRVRIWAVGERVHAHLVDAGLPLVERFTVPTSLKGIAPLVGQVLVASETRHEGTPMGELLLFHNRPTPVSVYAPVRQRLLPLDEEWRRRLAEVPWPNGNLPQVVGKISLTIRALIDEYLFISLFRACAESLASENASRLAAMERAEKNIDELLENLRGAFHRLRQSNIDEELFDVISGFDALIDPRPTGVARKREFEV